MVSMLPAVGVVEVGEEQNSTDEESDQHESAIHFMKKSVLLLVLRGTKRERERKGRNKGRGKTRAG